jgi:hypothetical protein
MKEAIVYFEGKEAYQVKCDRHFELDEQVTFYLNDEVIGSFKEAFCFSIYPKATHEQEKKLYELGKIYESLKYPTQEFKYVIYVSGDKTFK